MRKLTSHRAHEVLKNLIERYLESGQPVGSKHLTSTTGGMSLSSATIRNVLKDLEAAGYLASLHTSSGRVPTDRAFRLFVDSMLTVKPISDDQLFQFKKQLSPDLDTGNLLQTTTSLLSGITQLVGVVSTPRRNSVTLRRVEFLPLSDNRVLTILVVNERDVQNRVIHVDRPYSESELQQATNFINQRYAGLSMVDIRHKIVADMETETREMNRMMQMTVDIANKAFDSDEDAADIIIEGEANIIKAHRQSNVDELHHLIDTFSNKQSILHLLDKSLAAEGMQIFIGQESGHDALQDCSIVTAPYHENGQVAGVLGVIGPTRMMYDQVIPVVDITSKLLSSALKF